ncbi:hypothetical protein ACGCUQ_07110 [Eubacteriales bacterium KG127]
MKFIKTKAFDMMKKYLSEVDSDREVFCCDDNEDAIYSMLSKGVDKMVNFCEVKSTHLPLYRSLLNYRKNS